MANKEIKDTVKSLYEIMKDEKIQELEVNSKDYSVAIKRKDPNAGVYVQKDVVRQPAVAAAATAAKVKQDAAPASKGETIKSPIMGVFYQSPSPSSPVFAKEGDIVDAGKTVCIIEAMKVMNEIKATFKAKIVKVIAENGKPVNSGQDLFEIEKV
ncbi:acetyl-CoA carboxylase biotin carboxyl carrier protein [Endomicrobium proavitum]|uniref:Biotin carboxyl carrier protein of acetyl-CoA carboxylase n=1 Tax=Endomicrobium proavitum TaxID=1408281 RepID=A0A0G3WKI3_9BACT|nr:biotin/lipoyl-containing protein [Endomicrobium proavitum]AKL97959.1 Biotin carboxyl carrier protein of acetyl-CoA carboxylase [Endomicrobium proavitum]